MGLLAAIIGGVVWAAVTVNTGYQIGWMAVGVGALVGFAVRMGRGVDLYFGIIGAVLAFVGCALGNFLSMAGFIGKESGVDILQVLQTIDYSKVPETMMSAAEPMDLLFYGIAVYEGYRFSFRRCVVE